MIPQKIKDRETYSAPVADLSPATLDLSIIIVNYKSSDYTRMCLRSIRESLEELDHEVIVVDNHSQDGSVGRIRREFPNIRLIENDSNVGFSKANNQGIRISRGKFILLLSNDTYILPGSVRAMLEIMDRTPKAGLLGCRLLNPDYTLRESFGRKPGLITEFWRKLKLKILYQQYRRPVSREILEWYHSKEKEVDWVHGACMLFRREAFVDVGLMDENFFIFLGDVDMGIRLQGKGWKVVYTPDADIIHHGKGSVQENEIRKPVEYQKNQLYFFRKYYGRRGLLRWKFFLYCQMAKKFLRTQMQKKFAIGNSFDLEREGRLNRELFSLIRHYR